MAHPAFPPLNRVPEAARCWLFADDIRWRWRGVLGSVTAIAHETVRAVVEAYADGKIALPPPNLKAPGIKTRFAPSFIEGDVDRGTVNMPYTAQTIAEFIGCL